MIDRFCVLALLFFGCSNQFSGGKLYLAEKLLTEGRYEAAVGEFERVIAKDSSTRSGTMALKKAAEIQTHYLSQHAESLKKLKILIESRPLGEDIFAFRKEIARIYFEKTEQYDLALGQYRELLNERPDGSEAPFFLFRIGRSQFYLWSFESAIKTFRKITKEFPLSNEAELAQFELGTTYLTAGDRIPGGFQAAKNEFEQFIKTYGQSKKLTEARFGIANCLEELGQYSDAQELYRSLIDTFPSPNVVKIRLTRLNERLTLKKGKDEKQKDR